MAEPSSSFDQTPGGYEAHLAAIRADGYTILEHAVSQDVVGAIRDELSPYLKGEYFGRNDFEGFKSERVYALLDKSPSMTHIVEHADVLALVDNLLPKNYLLSSALAINVHPGETPQRFHSDDHGNSLPIPRPRPHVGVSVIWALDDFTETNGATEIVPGSHLWGPDREPSESDAIKVVMPAGSAIVFLGNIFHRGGGNHSDRARLGITPQYCAPTYRPLETMTLAVGQDKVRSYSERIQALLGYSINDPGFHGHVNGRHPRVLLDPDYRGRKYRGDLPES